MSHIIKARGRQGTKSLDITIPSEVQRKCKIHKGDLFKIEIETEDQKTLTLKYTRIYEEK